MYCAKAKTKKSEHSVIVSLVCQRTLKTVPVPRIHVRVCAFEERKEQNIHGGIRCRGVARLALARRRRRRRQFEDGDGLKVVTNLAPGSPCNLQHDEQRNIWLTGCILNVIEYFSCFLVYCTVIPNR